MEDKEWRRSARPLPPSQPADDQYRRPLDVWNSRQKSDADKQPETTPFHSQHESESEAGQEFLLQRVDDLSLQAPSDASPLPSRSCTWWVTNGSCTDTNCQFAHHLFPRIVYRAHRGGSEKKDCHMLDRNLACYFAEDMCGFSHEKITSEVESKQQHMSPRIKDQRQDWVAELTLRCRRCSFTRDGNVRGAIDEVVEHCRNEHETSTLNAMAAS